MDNALDEQKLPAPEAPKPKRHGFNFLAWVLVLVCAIFAGAIIYLDWQFCLFENSFLDKESFKPLAMVAVEIPTNRIKAPEQVVKGLYLTAFSATNPKKLQEIIDLIGRTELNAVVIDIKDYTGYVLYDSQVPLAKQLHTTNKILKNLTQIVKKLHEHHIYVIAREVVFQDPVLAAKKPEWAIKDIRGGVWRDRKGLAWVDPTRPEVWNYNIDIAKEVATFGFDEINFDYVRFPSDGDISKVVYDMSGRTKYEVMGKFYETLGKKMADEPVWLSLDMYGFSMEATGTNDLSIGQRLDDAVDWTDYICPMMYPSHYPKGHLNFKNPADHPTEIFDYGMRLGMPHFVGKRAKVRPWIQAFNMGAIYDGAKIRAQIDEVERYADSGWLMWNASNRYTTDGLKAK